MGLPNQLDVEDWDRKQRSDYQNSERHTVVVLPCCGSSIEVSPKDGSDQYITCTNKKCPKWSARGPARHLLTWALHKQTIQSERPPVEL